MLAMNKIKILGTTVIVIAATIIISSCKDKRSTGWEYAPNMYEHLAYDPDQKNDNFKDGKNCAASACRNDPCRFCDDLIIRILKMAMKRPALK